MSDQTLLLSGIVVTFIFASGVYVFVRERFERGPQETAIPVDSLRAPLSDAERKT